MSEHDPTYGFYDYAPPAEESKERRYHYFNYPAAGRKVLQGASEPDGNRELVESHFGTAQRRILDRFPSNMEGLDIDRVNTFMDGFGLRRPPLVVIDKSQKFEMDKFTNETIASGDYRKPDDYHDERDQRGWHGAETDVAVVYRDRELEELNGPGYTESLIVHELAHGSAEYWDMRVLTQSVGDAIMAEPTRPRHGLEIQHNSRKGAGPEFTGTFLEEMWAEQIRATYITDVLGLKHGFAKLPSDTVPGRNSETGLEFRTPSKYFYFYGPNLDQDINLLGTSYAGAAGDALIARDPDLFPALIRARRDVNGIREVVQRINAIHPGLYKALRDDFNNDDQFANGYFHVLATVNDKAISDQGHLQSGDSTGELA